MRSCLAISVSVLLLFLSCKTLVTDNFPDFESYPTINSILVEGKPITIDLSLTEGLNNQPIQKVNNAKIELYVNGILIEQLKEKENGKYISEEIVKAGNEYRCNVIIPNHDTIVCSQSIPKATPIVNIKHINIAGRNEEGISYPAIELTIENSTSEINYYEVFIYCIYKGKINTPDSIYEMPAWLVAISDPILLNEGLPIALFSNELMNDKTHTLYLNYWNGGSGGPHKRTRPPFFVSMRTVSADYYRFKKQLYLYNEGIRTEIVESMSALPLYSNINNGYGIYAGYSTFNSDTITPEPYYE